LIKSKSKKICAYTWEAGHDLILSPNSVLMGPRPDRYSRTSGEKKILRHEKHAKKMSACGHQPSCSNRLGESSRLAVFLLFYKEKGFYARTLVTPAGVI